ncbi:uncharacterized protein V6R79_015587 [Siganus canaliculatus]
MESPSSKVRRRGWINSSRQWLTLEEQDPEGASCTLTSASIADDDVFSDGCFTGKIENWLLSCGSDAHSDNVGQCSFESVLKADHFDDELSLGADASLLNTGETTSKARQGHGSAFSSTPLRGQCLPSLNLGHSFHSTSTCKTTSSVSEVLQLCSEDAEETLYELGFGRDEPQVTVRIPPRFFTFPSLAQGINFRLFLDSQLRRIREEDPSLSLASRFRQVQVLTAMANAFYSLYSHVSRTPLQKLATPEFTFSSPVERIERFRSSVRSEPRSPVERLKDTVSKMCLYTGSPRGSDSTSPQPSPKKRSSLPDVVDIVLEKVKSGVTKKLDLGENEMKNTAVDTRLVSDDDESCDSREKEKSQQMIAATDALHNANKNSDSEEKDDAHAREQGGKKGNSGTHSVGTSLESASSEETVICQPQPDSDTRPAPLQRAAKVTHDLICPQIVESVQQALFCTHILKTSTLPPETERIDKPHAGSSIQSAVLEADKVSHTCEASSVPVVASGSSLTQFCITVTGWEGDDIASCSLNAPDSSHTSTIPPVQACEESFNEGKRQYLKPVTHQSLGHLTNNPQQVNSFELEEVHSAGEEDFGQSENTGTTASTLSKNSQRRGGVVRGDSMQSDSSGYADEEVNISHSR